MSKTRTKASEPKARRFYRSNLSTIVWDKVNNQPLADFSAGHFTTDNPKTARKLIELGYPEIPLDAAEPPSNILIQQPATTIDGDVPIMNAAIPEKMMEAKMEARTKTIGGPPQLKKSITGGASKLPRRRKKTA